jgi:hypothetical protein
MADGRSTRWTSEQRALAAAKSIEIAAKRRAAFKIPERKICRVCKVKKALADFPAHPDMRDGHLNHCQACVNAAVVARYAAKPKVRKVRPTKAQKLAALPTDFKLKCEECSVEKLLDQFGKSELGKYGVRRTCRVCLNSRELSKEDKTIRAARAAVYRKANPDRVRAHRRASYVKHKIKRNSKRGEYRLQNIEREREREAKYIKNNRGIVRAKNSRRRAAEMSATPKWLTPIQKAQTQSFYEIAIACEMQTGKKYHVDHIVPLRGKSVNGLHVPWNLQVLTEFENCSKHNRLIEGSV